jgi:hypothetical protein
MNKMVEYKPNPLESSAPSWAHGILGLVSSILGVTIVQSYNLYNINQNLRSQQVKSVSTRDVNNDGLADIVIEREGGDKTVYYGTRDGEYLTTEQMKQREIEKIETAYQEQLRRTDEFYGRAYDGNDRGGRE